MFSMARMSGRGAGIVERSGNTDEYDFGEGSITK
jgi:hypothetical protein